MNILNNFVMLFCMAILSNNLNACGESDDSAEKVTRSLPREAIDTMLSRCNLEFTDPNDKNRKLTLSFKRKEEGAVEGRFDLSPCGDVFSEQLSIGIGLPEKWQDSDGTTLKIWIVPRYLFEEALKEGGRLYKLFGFNQILDDWEPAIPAGIFFAHKNVKMWGYRVLMTWDIDALFQRNFWSLWRASTGRVIYRRTNAVMEKYSNLEEAIDNIKYFQLERGLLGFYQKRAIDSQK